MPRRQKGLNFYKKRKKIDTNILKEILSWVFCIVVSIFLAFVCVYAFGLRTSVIGASMETSLYNGQEILVNRLIYQVSSPKRDDIVVFLPNGNHNTHYYVKRVVAVPGELVQIKEGKLYVNGVLQDSIAYDKIADPGIAENELKLGNDEYFVLGDNVNSSEDSRSGNIAAIKKDTIYGKVWFKMASKDSGLGLVR
ncbi:MAG: signal peptidase I [Lachnospiraceae bacterium]|nr:signal peptidase I [Lachnospiraceae bacterium]